MSSSLSKLISIGELIKPHGIKGELKILFFNENSKSLKDNQVIFLSDNENNFYEHRIERIIYSIKKNRIKLFEIDSIDSAESLRGYIINISRSDFPDLKEGEYYLNDLIGYSLLDENDEHYGVVADVFHFPANNVLSILLKDKEYLIPIIDDIVLNIIHDSKNIVINPMKGLFDWWRYLLYHHFVIFLKISHL